MTSVRPGDIPRAYQPKDVEKAIYDKWLEKGYFTSVPDPSKKPFVIIMPPPNVTGGLHLGHALEKAIQDILVRWHRMLGDPVLWLPGKDHAGIATQVEVERHLAKQGLDRQKLGRETFLQHVWDWVNLYGTTIDKQHQRLGISCDWSRMKFTLDPGPSKAVVTTFVNLFNKGLIYRGERIINWCIRCSTALSDLEVIHEETEGQLYYVQYSLAGNLKNSISIATTRIETILADTAVAVHPNDKRYSSLIGQEAIVPIVNRPVPIIADESINPLFGTGVLKVTPGHDATDFDIGQRHELPTITVIDDEGLMTSDIPLIQGQDRFDARESIKNLLEQEGLLEKIEPHTVSLGHCQRCHSIVEPLISNQWWLNVKPLATRAVEAVRSGQISIVPKRFVKVYINWMENIRDWCISRQLWWGHRIPVWYCEECDEIIVSAEQPTTCNKCSSVRLHQDPDVLDTWFSSGLWTHSTLGWPENTDDLNYYYPSAVMETGYDILFFWVARMIMMGIENMGTPPFHTVFLHGMIRDADGLKMSKTRGNVLDPLQLMDIYGTDALRFALTIGCTPGNDQRLNETKLESSRNFANKIWNASRFVLNSISKSNDLDNCHDLPELIHQEDKWIISRLNRIAKEVDSHLSKFEIGEAQSSIYDFLWNEFCDWYIELAKIRINENSSPSPIKVLSHVLEKTLRLLHPFMPFITEEIWTRLKQALPKDENFVESIMISPYPLSNPSLLDPDSERGMEEVISLIRSIRNIRAQLRIEPSLQIEAIIDPKSSKRLIAQEEKAIKSLARLSSLYTVDHIREYSTTNLVTTVSGQIVVGLYLEGILDVNSELARLNKEIAETVSNLERIQTLLSKDTFISNAPAEVVEKERQRGSNLEAKLSSLKEVVQQLEGS